MLPKALEYLARPTSAQGLVPGFAGRSRIYERQGRLDLALQAYQEAIDLENATRKPSNEQSRSCSNRGDTRTPIVCSVNSKVSRDPFLPVEAGFRGSYGQGEFDRALKNVRKAVSPDSNDCQEQVWLGQMLGILASQAQPKGKLPRPRNCSTALKRPSAAPSSSNRNSLPYGCRSFGSLAGSVRTARPKRPLSKPKRKSPPRTRPRAARCLEIVNESDAGR